MIRVLITIIVTGAYKPTYNWGASHCTDLIVISKDNVPPLLGRSREADVPVGADPPTENSAHERKGPD